MEQDNRPSIELLLTAQVLTLAKTMKLESRAKGIQTTNDFIRDAVREVKRQQPKILALLADIQ